MTKEPGHAPGSLHLVLVTQRTRLRVRILSGNSCNQSTEKVVRQAMRFLFLISIGIAAIWSPATAQTEDTSKPEELSTDRPDQTEAPRLVPRAYFQAEAGFATTYFREESETGPKTAATGILFLRYGLLERVELRAVLEEGRGRDRFIQESTQGLYPLALGTKIGIIKEQKGLLPEASVIAYLNLPFLPRADSQRGLYHPALIAAFENKFLEKYEIEYNVGWQQDAFDAEYQWLASASLHYELSQKLKLFAEYFAQYMPGDAPLHNADGGLLYEFADNMQLDFAAGGSIRAQPENRNYFGALGLSVRLPR